MQKPQGKRGSSSNHTSRFHSEQKSDFSPDLLDDFAEPEVSPLTKFFVDHSKSILNKNTSPDMPFSFSLNPYRGCEHGCAYCYARPTHEYLGLSAGVDFESKIFYKEKAPELLRAELMKKSWQGSTIFLSGVTDCYQPAERKFELTRNCLKILAEFRNPAALISKNFLITRDIDILQDLAKDDLVVVYLSITSLRAELARDLEPRTSTPAARLRAIEIFAKAGIPVGVNVAPIIPGLTSHELPQILKAAKEAGASFAGHTPVRLPYSVKDIFSEWLDTHRPEQKNKVLNAIRAIRDGKLNDPNFSTRMQGTGEAAEALHALFDIFCRKYKLNEKEFSLAHHHFRRPGEQLSLF